MPIALALAAGGLSTLNPCGFSLLPAMLSFYVGDDEGGGSRSLLQSLQAGAYVTAGFLGIFLLIGGPIVLGLGQIVRAIPWAGALTGVAIAVAGIVALSGRHIGLSFRFQGRRSGEANTRSMLLFGVAYAVASLGCTLPVFLSVVGASLAARGPAGASVVLLVYGLGMASVMMTLAIAAGAFRVRMLRFLRGVLPHMNRISGVLLTIAGVYLTYYWGRILFGPLATLADDPIVGTVQRFTSSIERVAARSSGVIAVVSVLVVAAAVGYVLIRVRGTREPAESADEL